MRIDRYSLTQLKCAPKLRDAKQHHVDVVLFNAYWLMQGALDIN
jgi:hypothetical protein